MTAEQVWGLIHYVKGEALKAGYIVSSSNLETLKWYLSHYPSQVCLGTFISMDAAIVDIDIDEVINCGYIAAIRLDSDILESETFLDYMHRNFISNPVDYL